MQIAVGFASPKGESGGNGGVPVRRPLVLVSVAERESAAAHNAADEFDRSLIAQLRQDDARALDQLLRRHADGLTRYASVLVGSTDLAQDVVQDVFIKLWERRHVDAISGHVGGYFLRMTRNRALNFMRHERSQRRVAHDAADPSIIECEVRNAGEAALEADELGRLIQEAIVALSPRVREIFLMRRQARMSAPAVAEALGISTAAVHVQLSRALQRIAQHIADHLD